MPKLEKLDSVSMFFLLETIHPILIPGDCNPFVQAPAMNTLLLSKVLYELNSTHRRRVKHLVCLIQKDAVFGTLRQSD